MEHSCHLDDSGEFNWSLLIEKGIKKYEGRVNDEKRQSWKKGDWLTIHCQGPVDKELRCKIVDLKYYKNFGKAWEDLKDLLVPAKDSEHAINVYSKYFSEEMIEKYGIVCIGIEMIRE